MFTKCEVKGCGDKSDYSAQTILLAGVVAVDLCTKHRRKVSDQINDLPDHKRLLRVEDKMKIWQTARGEGEVGLLVNALATCKERRELMDKIWAWCMQWVKDNCCTCEEKKDDDN